MASTNIARYKLFINGAWVDSASGKTFRSVDPFTGEDWAEVPEGDATDVAAAIDGARAAFENSWWRREPRKRAQVMQRLADFQAVNCQSFIEFGSLLKVYQRNYGVCSFYDRASTAGAAIFSN